MPDKKMMNSDLRRGLIAGVGSLVLVGGLHAADFATTKIYETIKANSIEPAGSFTPGTYTAEAQGIGTVKATLTFNETNLTEVELDTSQETPDIGGAATEVLKEELLEAQAPEIDAVAGATVTSDAVMQAARSAFNQAAGIEEEPAEEAAAEGEESEAAAEGAALEAGAETEGTAEEPEEGAEAEEAGAESEDAAAAGLYTPGTYTATAMGIGNVTVTMTFDENSITEVELDTSEETPEIGGAAAETLREAVLAAQSSDIDAVAGATVTTTAVQTAAADCIAQASVGGGDTQAAGDGASGDVSAATEEAVQKIEEAADQSAQKITDAAEAAVQKITDAADQAAARIAEAAGATAGSVVPVQTGDDEAPSGETAKVSYEPGVYQVVAKGIGHVGVTLTVDESGRISDMQLDTSEETAEIGGAAADTLIAETLEAQNADIDIVSGATQTSEAVKSALRTILTEAGGEAALAAAEPEEAGSLENASEGATEVPGAEATAEIPGEVKAGTYSAQAQGLGLVGVTLTLAEDGTISDVQADTSEETPEIGGAAAETLIQEVLETQSADIDTVSGATLTSNAVKNAVKTILVTAGKEAASEAVTAEETVEKAAEEMGSEAEAEEAAEEANPEEESEEAGVAEKTITEAAASQIPGIVSAPSFDSYKAGTWTAEAKGLGTVGVTLTIDENGVITDVQTDTSEETPEIGGAAAEVLVQEVLEKQNGDVDNVSGATMTSAAVRNAVNTILAAAGEGTAQPAETTGAVAEEEAADAASAEAAETTEEAAEAAETTEETAEAAETTEEIPESAESAETPADGETAGTGVYKPGTYTGYAKGLGGILSASVTVTEDTITDIVLNLENETPEIGQAAGDTLKQEILAAQSAEVDGVTGATTTSTGILSAVRNALAQARN